MITYRNENKSMIYGNDVTTSNFLHSGINQDCKLSKHKESVYVNPVSAPDVKLLYFGPTNSDAMT